MLADASALHKSPGLAAGLSREDCTASIPGLPTFGGRSAGSQAPLRSKKALGSKPVVERGTALQNAAEGLSSHQASNLRLTALPKPAIKQYPKNRVAMSMASCSSPHNQNIQMAAMPTTTMPRQSADKPSSRWSSFENQATHGCPAWRGFQAGSTAICAARWIEADDLDKSSELATANEYEYISTCWDE